MIKAIAPLLLIAQLGLPGPSRSPQKIYTYPAAPGELRACARLVLARRGETILASGADTDTLRTKPRLIDAEELKKIAHTERRKIHWTKGMVLLRLEVNEAGISESQFKIQALILGYGESQLPLMGPMGRASPWFPLPSNGTLEEEIANEVKEKCEN
jgi:hypothetical protein